MRRPSAPVLVSALFPLLAACAIVSGRRESGADERNVITTDELRAAGFADAFRVVEALRPQWLRTRGVTTLTGRETVKVYLDDLLLGGPEHLQQITTTSISSIRYLDGNEATQRWGLDHGHGAILVLTRP